MGKPVVGEVVVLPFPQTDLHTGKRRPALVAADSTGTDVVFCQITSQPHAGVFTAARLKAVKMDEVKSKLRRLFS